MKTIRLRKLPAAVLRRLARYGVFRTPIKYAYDFYYRRHRWGKAHPLDLKYGTETSGFVPGFLLDGAANIAYLGCQPVALRQALSTIPGLDECTFVDMGCGKGRALIVATEFPLKKIIGIELDRDLASAAAKNASIMAARDASLPRIEVIHGNVLDAALPAGRKVIFNYHAFGIDVLEKLNARLTQTVVSENEDLYFIYMNPVNGHVLDRSPRAERWDSRMIALTGQDFEGSLDGQETTVVWRISSSITSPTPVRPGEEIRIVLQGLRAQLAMSPSGVAGQAVLAA